MAQFSVCFSVFYSTTPALSITHRQSHEGKRKALYPGETVVTQNTVLQFSGSSYVSVQYPDKKHYGYG